VSGSSGPYEYALGLTSQYLYCGLPLRLDAYSKCSFGCLYCFAKARGGNFSPGILRSLDTEWLGRKLRSVREGKTASLLDEFLARRVPIHFGGMSDPFPPLEARRGISHRTLEILAENDYPTVISTKSALFGSDQYLDTLKRGSFVIQVSVSTSSEQLHRRINIGTPPLCELFASVSKASAKGIPTVCRIQPALPNRTHDVIELIDLAAASGVKHVAVEHLKLAMEKESIETKRLSSILGYDLVTYYRSVGSKRAGREWMLPIGERLPSVLNYRKRVKALGMTFGAADTDLLFLSDGSCCCNASDLLLPNANTFKFTMNEAIRKGMKSNQITFASISAEWRPSRSIKRFVNSKCRTGVTLEDHFRIAWNRNSHGPSMTNFAGVVATDDLDDDGMKIYRVDDNIRLLSALAV
jgi:DNA repair photolyase